MAFPGLNELKKAFRKPAAAESGPADQSLASLKAPRPKVPPPSASPGDVLPRSQSPLSSGTNAAPAYWLNLKSPTSSVPSSLKPRINTGGNKPTVKPPAQPR